MDLSKLTDADLLALKAGDLTKVSDDGLAQLKAMQPAPEAPEPPAPETRSVAAELGRQAGLTVRAGAKGIMAIPSIVVDGLVTAPLNTALDVYDYVRSPNASEIVTGKQKGFRFKRGQDALDEQMNKLGLPQPETATERVAGDVASAMSGAATGAKLADLLAGTAKSSTVQGVARSLARGPGTQVVSAGTGTAAGSIARENDVGPGGQLLASLAGTAAAPMAVAGGAEALRRLLRGGEAGRQTTADNLRMFSEAGTQPSVGQATEGRLPRAIESVLSKTPGGAGVMARKAEGQAADLSKTVGGIADDLSPGASAFKAGEAVSEGAKSFKAGFKAVQEKLYTKLDQHIPAQTPVNVTRTQQALKDLNADIPGAPNLSEWFKNSKIQGIDAAMEADLKAAGQGVALPYEAIKKLRTLVGREITDGSLLSDVPRSKWTALYGALSEDLGDTAKKAGPQAEGAWQWANQYTKSQLGRLEQLEKVVSKDAPEQIFSAAISGTAEGDTLIKRVVSAIPKDNRKDLAAAVIQRLGRATPGKQNDIGEAFSTETFLTNWNRLSPEARSTIFGRTGVANIQNRLESVAGVASNVREGSKVFANPSGTQQATAAHATGVAGITALLMGQPGVAAGLAAVPVSANLLARRMTNPNFARWLGNRTEVSPGLAPAEVNALMQYLQGAQPAQEPRR
jgi:hypothetical protein